MVLEEKGQTLNRGKNEHVHELQLEIGKAISEKRISKGLTIAQVEATTKISQSFIVDIELGNFERLPGKIFGRGFIKNICIFLEMDYRPILEKYEKSWIYVPEAVKEGSQSRPFSFFLRERAHNISFSPSIFSNFSLQRFAKYLLIPVVLLMLVFFIRFLSQRGATQEAPTTNTTPTAASVPSASPTPPSAAVNTLPAKIETPAPTTQMSLVSKESPKQTPLEMKKTEFDLQKKLDTEHLTTHDNKALVILTVKEEVKIKHRTLPDDYTFTTFTPGVYKFPFDEQVDLVLFDAGAVEIIFNGKNLGLIGKKGEERKLSFSAKEGPNEIQNKSETKI